MKRYILFLSFLCATLLTYAGKEGKCGENVKYELSSDGSTLTIRSSSSGTMSNFSYDKSAPWRAYPIKTIIIEDGVTNIGDYAFFNCLSLTSVTIPNSVTSIGNSAFSGCFSLTSVTIPDGVTSIGGRAFSGCSGLTTITIPNSVTSVGSYAFSGCTNLPVVDNIRYADCVVIDVTDKTLSSYRIKNETRLIGDNAFQYCSGLISITIPNSVTSIGEYAFYYCSGLTSITIPNSVTSIGGRSFWNCSSLTSITIPEGVTSIGNCTFSGCRGLTSITIPNSVTSIGDDAFYNCSGLTSITIPNSVTSIGNGAFHYCSGLTSVRVLAATPPTAGSDMLYNAGTSTIHVYEGLADAYKAASGWSSYNIVDDIKPSKVTLVDGDPYTAAVESDYNALTYTRTFDNTEWQALYVPFQMSYEDWCDEFEVAKINMFHQYDRDEDGTPDDLELEVFKVKSGTLKPNHPYLIKAQTTGEKTITLANATLYPAEQNALTCSSVETQYTFTGTYSGVSGADMYTNHYYSMGGGALVYAEDATAALKPYRWYLKLTDREGQVIPAPSQIRVMEWNGQTTAVEGLSLDNAPARAMTLDGRCVKDMKVRGLYIVNGKKVLR